MITNVPLDFRSALRTPRQRNETMSDTGQSLRGRDPTQRLRAQIALGLKETPVSALHLLC